MMRMPLPRDWNSLSQKHPTLFKASDVSKKLGFAIYKAIMLVPMFIAHFVLFWLVGMVDALQEAIGHAKDDYDTAKQHAIRAPRVAFGKWYDRQESEEFKQACDQYRYAIRKGQ